MNTEYESELYPGQSDQFQDSSESEPEQHKATVLSGMLCQLHSPKFSSESETLLI